MLKNMFSLFVSLALLCAAFVASAADAPLLISPKTPEEIEAFFLQFKPAPDDLQPKGFNTEQEKGITRRLLDDNAALDKLPRLVELIHFRFDSSAFERDSYATLEKAAKAFNGKLADATILVFGHTDNIGDAAYNLELSRQRAEAVKQALIEEFQIEASRISVKFYGESDPMDTNDTKVGRAMNRRVEFSCVWLNGERQ